VSSSAGHDGYGFVVLGILWQSGIIEGRCRGRACRNEISIHSRSKTMSTLSFPAAPENSRGRQPLPPRKQSRRVFSPTS
jgi:hypothetical protein